MGFPVQLQGAARAIVAAVVLTVLSPPGADASRVNASAPPDTTVYFFDPIVVTAVRPTSALTVIANPKDPRQPVPASDGADFLRSIPGFASIRNGGTNGDPVLRGMFGSRLNVLTDGSSMHGGCPSRMDAPSSYISPESFDLLTVVKGPQTVAWGPGASAGTIRFERITPAFAVPSVRIEPGVLGGSRGRNDQRADLVAGSPRAYARLTGSRGESGDYHDGDGHIVPSRYLKWSADAALGWTPVVGTVVELNGGTGDGNARYAGRGMDGARFLRQSLGVHFAHTRRGRLWSGVEARVSFHDADHVMDNYSLRTPDPMSMMAMPMAAQVERRTLTGRLTSDFRLSDAVRVQGGVDANSSAHRGRSAPGIGGYEAADWIDDADMSDVGWFGEATWGRANGSQLAAGLRVDLASAKDRRKTTGGMAPMPNATGGDRRDASLPSGFMRYVHGFGPRASAYAGVGHTERFPDYWELFSPDAGPAGAVNAFEGLQPERTTQLDLGTQFNLGRVRGWVSAYAGLVQDYIIFEYTTGMMGASSKARNIDAGTAGGEAGATLALARAWSCDASMAYAWGEKRDQGTPLPQMPPLEGRLTLSFDDRVAWSFGVLARGVAAQRRGVLDEGNVVGRDLGDSPGFAVFSLNGARRLGNGVRLAAGVDNLLDRAYGEHLNLAGDSAFGYPADPVRVLDPGRTFWLSLSVKP